jgi:hypothetical protein
MEVTAGAGAVTVTVMLFNIKLTTVVPGPTSVYVLIEFPELMDGPVTTAVFDIFEAHPPGLRF